MMGRGGYMHRIAVRHGMPVVVLLMFAAVARILTVTETSVRIPVELSLEHDGRCYCHLPASASEAAGRDSVAVLSYDGRPVRFVVLGREHCQYSHILLVTPVDSVAAGEMFRGGRKAEGYMITGTIRLWKVVFSGLYGRIGR